ncbi:MAG: hypothetical protein V1912_10310, partial [bacterium]
MAGLAVAAIGLGLGLGGFVSGCGGVGTPDAGTDITGPAAATALPEVPPIDVLAPSSFKTASFA